MELQIDAELKNNFNCSLGIITAKISNQKDNTKLWEATDQAAAKVFDKYNLENLKDVPEIKDVREVYKFLGKDPSRHRVSSEALIRRILQKKDLYRVNTIVDVNNLISIESLLPVGSYDFSKINPPLSFRVERHDKEYEGIGKGAIKIDCVPVLADINGAFGSPISDSKRTMITEDTQHLLMVIYSFSGSRSLNNLLQKTGIMLEKYSCATSIESSII